MTHIRYAALAIGVVTIFSGAQNAFAQGGAMACRQGGRCISTTTANYNRCVNLALRRGLNQTRGDRYNFDLFVYDCVAGRTGR